MSKPRKPRLNLNPHEHEVQAWILASLGVEQFEMVKHPKTGSLVMRSKNLWLSRDGQGFFWRMNAGWFRSMGSNALVRGGPAGGSDICGVVHGVPVFLEVKRVGGAGKAEPQRPDQRTFQQIVGKSGALYAVVTSVAQANAFVERIRRRHSGMPTPETLRCQDEEAGL